YAESEPSEPVVYVVVVDKTVLQEKVEDIDAENLAEPDYTEESWEELEEALTKAREVLDNEEATQKEVDEALAKLEAAYEGLKKWVPEVQTVEVNEPNKIEVTFDRPIALEELEGFTIEVDGEEVEVTNFDIDGDKLTLTLGTNIEAGDSVTVRYVDEEGELEGTNGEPVKSFEEEATNHLFVDKTALQEKVEETEDLVVTDYTEKSWKELEEALAKAREVLDNEEATQKEVDEALSKLKESLDGLTLKVEITEPKESVNVNKPTITGTATPGSEVTIELEDEEGNKVTGTATADEDGNWTYTPDEPLENGTYEITVTAEKDGKTSEPVTGSIEIEVIPEPKPEVTVEEPTEPIEEATPTFTGTATPGSLVTIELTDSEGNKVTGTVTADEEGNWSYTPKEPLENGTYTISVTAEKDGEKSELVSGVIEIDVAPVPEPEPEVTVEEPTEPIDTATPTITGTATPGSLVTIELTDSEGNKVTGTVTADEEGNWSFTPDEPLENGTYTITVTAELNGKTSPIMSGELTIDTVDKSALQEEIELRENLDEENYSTDSWEAYQTALTYAQSVFANPEATQQEIDDAQKVLKEARENLTVDKSALQAKVDEADRLVGSHYSQDSWVDYQEALEKAEAF
ncbi:Ig-like domain-containing protein, partial [Bacillus sp. JCM 19034]|uniref:Ig-like domain-containing protein n=1 Tax=Bacillus sp. JCM 19034 TaxID=1481928 RepID=UPI000AD2396B